MSIVWLLVGGAPLCALAVQYPWLSTPNAQVLVVTDPLVDFALRVSVIDRAQSSIDMVTYVQDVDPVIGMPMLQAFRRAQSRGVSGRYVYARLANINLDPGDLPRSILADGGLSNPGQVISFGGIRNLFKGLRLTDFIHEKILIVDRGTPNETIFIGGRNNTKKAIGDIDTTFVIRPLSPGLSYIGDQVQGAYENMWAAVRFVQAPAVPQKKLKRDLRAVLEASETGVRLETTRQAEEFAALKAMLAKPASAQDPISPFEIRPFRMRVLTNDLLMTVLSLRYSRRLNKRFALESDIIEAAAPLIAGGRRIYLTSMTVHLPAPLKDALKEALKTGAEVHLITNSREAHEKFTPWGLGFENSLDDIVELTETGGDLSVYLLDRELLGSKSELYPAINYLHRKMLIVDDHVFVGSENYSRTSSGNNNEIALQVHDAEFAAKMISLVSEDLQVFSRLTCEQALVARNTFGFFKRGLNRLFLPFY